MLENRNMFEFLHIYFVQYRTEEGPIIEDQSFVLKIFLRIQEIAGWQWQSTPHPASYEWEGSGKAEAGDHCQSLYTLRCTVTAFMLIGGWENTSRSKNIQKIFSKTFDAHYPCVFYSRTMAPSPSVAMHYQSRGLEWILLQTNTYFNTLKSRCYFFRIFHYIICVFSK